MYDIIYGNYIKTLRSRIAKGGMKRFISKILSDEHDDTFILTIQV